MMDCLWELKTEDEYKAALAEFEFLETMLWDPKAKAAYDRLADLLDAYEAVRGS